MQHTVITKSALTLVLIVSVHIYVYCGFFSRNSFLFHSGMAAMAAIFSFRSLSASFSAASLAAFMLIFCLISCFFQSGTPSNLASSNVLRCWAKKGISQLFYPLLVLAPLSILPSQHGVPRPTCFASSSSNPLSMQGCCLHHPQQPVVMETYG